MRSIAMGQQSIRRTLIREWMSLPPGMRKTEKQANDFVAAALRRFELPRSNRSPQRVLKGWLLPRTARP
jgi:hypothetical protein